MSDSNSFTQTRYHIKFAFPNSISAFFKKGVEEFIFLILPEDTTENSDRRQSDDLNIPENKIRGTVKLLLWITISVAAALAVGQLK